MQTNESTERNETKPTADPQPVQDPGRGLALFGRSLSARMKHHHLVALIGSLDGCDVLDVGGLGGGLSRLLQSSAGGWTGAEFSEPAARRYAGASGVDVALVGEDPQLPFEDGSFDVVVITDRLERIQEDGVFIAECHRVLREKGRLAVLTPHLKKWGFLYPLRKMCGVDKGAMDAPRRGYTETALFQVLRDGFDVVESRTFMRYPSSKIDVLTRWMCGLVGTGEAWEAQLEDQDFDRLGRLYRRMGPLAWMGEKLDAWAIGTKGYHLAVLARRRIWKTRQAPKLRDGRSIADAAINTRIGSAAPF